MKSIYHVLDYSDRVMIFLVNVMIIDWIDLSEHNCVVYIEMNVSLNFILEVMYAKNKQRWAKEKALGNSWC